ncbi:hypothetical protein EI94DRAFT_1217801 [Lactarius quietus]|nr:hypothetical protein EI94DRAFT_1217801 [Lactarius quietus]
MEKAAGRCLCLSHTVLLSSPVAMAKEMMTRTRSLESILEGVEIKHTLVRAICPARCSIISLVYSPQLVSKLFCWLSRLSERNCPAKRKHGSKA